MSLAVTGVRHDTLVAFLTSGCQSCRGIWDVLRTGAPEVPGRCPAGRGDEGPGGRVPRHHRRPGRLGGARRDVERGVVRLRRALRPLRRLRLGTGRPGDGGGHGGHLGRRDHPGLQRGRRWHHHPQPVAAASGASPEAAGAQLGTAQALDTRWAKASADAEREARIDRELAAAGFLPGDPRLSPPPAPRDERR